MYSSKWNKYFMDIAKRTAELSKDPHTKVGAVLVKDKKIKSIGFNGAPKTYNDNDVPINNDSDKIIEQKNSFMIHSELNCILNYAGTLDELADCTLYVTVSPCHNCALFIAQLGIKEVIYLNEYRSEELLATKYIFNKCGVNLIKYEEVD